jgi:hypothetical protein
LHTWTARIIEAASAITIVAPASIKAVTKSGRGDAKEWGANVETAAAVNRAALRQAPGMAIEMLKYKAAEAGIKCDVILDNQPTIAVGGELVAAGKTLRRARRILRKEAA